MSEAPDTNTINRIIQIKEDVKNAEMKALSNSLQILPEHFLKIPAQIKLLTNFPAILPLESTTS